MHESAKLCNLICQNAHMGVLATDQLFHLVTDEKLQKHLAGQLEEYQTLLSSARDWLFENGWEEKGLSLLSKITTYLSIRLQAAKDNTPSHVAEMLIIGSNMGIVDAAKSLKHCQDADEKLQNLMERLLEVEENNIQQLKQFL